jgi:hypothetical protein
MREKRLIENEEDFDKERKEDEGRRRWVKDKKREEIAKWVKKKREEEAFSYEIKDLVF